METVTVTISIGLAVNGEPMTERDAALYVTGVEASLRIAGATVHFRGHGTGQSEEWGAEPAHTWVVALRALSLPLLRQLLAVDAEAHEQDAIGLTVGTFELVTS